MEDKNEIKDKIEQVVVFYKNSKATYTDVEDIRMPLSNKIKIIQNADNEYKITIINFNNIDSIELLYKKREVNYNDEK